MKPLLPVELLIAIFLISSKNRAVAAKLCRVSKWVRGMVEPELYSVLAFRSTPLEEMRQRLSSPQSRLFLNALGIVNGSMGILNAFGDGLSHQLNVRNLAIDGAYCVDLVDLSQVEELHLLTNRSLGQLQFPNLRRLHYSGIRVAPLFDGGIPQPSEILNQTGLKYIALSIPEEPNMARTISAIKKLLSEHRTLSLLFVRILRSTSFVLKGSERSTRADESLEGYLAATDDSRLIFQYIKMEAHPMALLNEWEENVRTGRSLWDDADLQVTRLNLARGPKHPITTHGDP